MNSHPIHLSYIGYFQFANLVTNRIPFLFINLTEDISGWFTSIAKLHLETYQNLIQKEHIDHLLEEKKIPKDFAMVILCSDGLTSETVYHQLEKKGYTNVYLVQGGLKQLVTERDAI